MAALSVQYEPLLVLLSIAVAAVGSFAGLKTVRQATRAAGVMRKALLATSAFAIGTSIWSMHFIGMLALSLPVTVSYDILITLISALVAILVTGIGLSFAVYGAGQRLYPLAGGTFMGLGTSSMHYIGMAAFSANVAMTYRPAMVVLSILVGVLAAIFSVWLASQERRGWQLPLAGLAMGLAISGMHYTAMAAMDFFPTESPMASSQPMMQPFTLAFGVAISTFIVVGFAVLCGLPAAAKGGSAAVAQPEHHDAAPVSPTLPRLPVERDRKKHYIAVKDIIAVKAAGHYTAVFTGEGEYFCSLSISDVEAMLDPQAFLRVHRSFIVSLSSVHSLEKQKTQGTLVLNGPSPMTVPVSRSNLNQLRRALELGSEIRSAS